VALGRYQVTLRQPRTAAAVILCNCNARNDSQFADKVAFEIAEGLLENQDQFSNLWKLKAILMVEVP
jgi:hypothetical protein